MTIETTKEIVSWIKHILIAVFLGLAMNQYVLVHANVPTGSMLDTIPLKSRVVGNRLSYLFNDPQRYDVIVFDSPDSLVENNPTLDKNAKPILFVKRLIGMPNEKLEIIDGKVYINDSPEPLDEPYLYEIPTGDFGPIIIPEGHYFMLGDNRNNSADARYWQYDKFVSKSEMKGKLIFTYYPQMKLIK